MQFMAILYQGQILPMMPLPKFWIDNEERVEAKEDEKEVGEKKIK